ADAGLIARDRRHDLEQVAARYAVAITPAMADLLDGADDPIGRQFIPDPRELDDRPEELVDPIGDDAHSPVAGVAHRYPDRVLIKLRSIRATSCGFCFRRETVGRRGGAVLSRQRLAAALSYIARHPDVWEVILSGGDPLVLSDRRLAGIVGRLAAIAHVKVLRLHT